MTQADAELTAFAKNLRRAREAVDLTQRELARRAGLDRTYVCNLEHGTANPSLLKMADLARVLGVSVASLVTVPSPDNPVPTDMLATVDCRAVLSDVIAALHKARAFG